MSINFEFNAPQFFNKSEDPDADRFFDVPVEENELKSSSSIINTNRRKSSKGSEIENQDPASGVKNLDVYKPDWSSSNSRKVLSELVNHQVQGDVENCYKENVVSAGIDTHISRCLESLHISKIGSCRTSKKMPVSGTEVFEGIKILKETPKEHSMTTRLDASTKRPVLKLRSRCIPIANKSLELNSGPPDARNVSMPTHSRKSLGTKRKRSSMCSEKKFVSLAERIQHFHYDTPDRFRSIPKKNAPQNIMLRQTIPKTPVLFARLRQRPVNFPDEKEREEMEIKEMKKHQVKAYPLNEKILKGPVLNLRNPIEKRATTVPAPFKLTEAKKKEQPQTPVFVFKAHPLPTTILNGPVGIPPKKTAKATVPMTPNIKLPLRFTSERDVIKASNSDNTFVSKTTKVQPFSFDDRIKEVLTRKEENIKKIIEEEKKAFNSFKAYPLPSYIGKCYNNSPNRSQSSVVSVGSKREYESKLKSEKAKSQFFKAKPATVIHQKPFVPLLPKHEALVPENITLNTEIRALERQKFDEKIKKKEEIRAQILQQRREEQEQLAQEKMLEERKLTEFKAKPVPKYKPFEIVPADPSILTIPKTPKCLSSK